MPQDIISIWWHYDPIKSLRIVDFRLYLLEKLLNVVGTMSNWVGGAEGGSDEGGREQASMKTNKI